MNDKDEALQEALAEAYAETEVPEVEETQEAEQQPEPEKISPQSWADNYIASLPVEEREKLVQQGMSQPQRQEVQQAPQDEEDQYAQMLIQKVMGAIAPALIPVVADQTSKQIVDIYGKDLPDEIRPYMAEAAKEFNVTTTQLNRQQVEQLKDIAYGKAMRRGGIKQTPKVTSAPTTRTNMPAMNSQPSIPREYQAEAAEFDKVFGRFGVKAEDAIKEIL